MNIAIIDNEEIIRNQLNKSIIDYCNTKDIPIFKTELYNSGTKFIENKKRYDIVFLDIDMPGLDGIQVANAIREYDCKCYIVFVTGFDNMRYSAFNVHAFGYIEKPYKDIDIKKILDDIISYNNSRNNEIALSFICENGKQLIKINDILYFEYLGMVSSKRSIRIKCTNTSYLMHEQIGPLSTKMLPYGFDNPHRAFLVNFSHVSGIKSYNVLLSNGELIPLSQKKSVYFRTKLTEYFSAKIG